jgi:predicted lactoylglutathione lyase
MLFVELPVRDLAAARAFHEALGFRVPHVVD